MTVHFYKAKTRRLSFQAPSEPGSEGEGAGGRSYLMLMANSAESFTLCRTRKVPSERLASALSAPARSMGPAYLQRQRGDRAAGPPCPGADLQGPRRPPQPGHRRRPSGDGRAGVGSGRL